MRGSSSRGTRIWTIAGLGLAALGIVAWILLRASSTPTAVPQVDVVVTPSADSVREEAPPPPLERGTRVAETTTEAEPHAKAFAAFDSTLPEKAPPARPVASGTIRLFGNVTTASGEPIDRPARVEINGPFDTRNVQVVRGAYVIEGLAPGNYQARCSAPGLRDDNRPILIAPGETEQREDFVLTPSWSVAIRLVTTDGRNVLDLGASEAPSVDTRLSVVATADPPPEQWSPRSFEYRTARRNSRYRPRTDDQGVLGDPDGTCSGRLDVFLPPPVHLAAEIQGIVLGSTHLDIEEKVATIEIALEKVRELQCSLRGRIVRSEDGSPIAHAQVHLYAFMTGRPLELDADNDGIFWKGELSPGSYTLMTNVTDRGLVMKSIELLQGVENDLGTIELGQPMHIRGRFLDGSGHAEKSNVYVMPYDPERPLETLYTNVFTDAEVSEEGRFEISGLAPRVYVLVSTNFIGPGGADGWTAPVVVNVTHGSVDDLVIEVKPSVSVMLHPVSTEARELSYWILYGDGILCQRGGFRDRGDTRVFLGAGRFRLCVGRDASSVREIPFTVGKAPVTVEVAP